METRNILNHAGDVIGTLEMPGNTPEDIWAAKLAVFAAPPPAVIIPPVTPVQMRKALVLSGISIADVDAALATLEEPLRSLATIEWEYALSFDRYHTTADFVASALGWTSEQVDGLWNLAATL